VGTDVNSKNKLQLVFKVYIFVVLGLGLSLSGHSKSGMTPWIARLFCFVSWNTLAGLYLFLVCTFLFFFWLLLLVAQSTESMRKAGVESGARAKKRNPYKAAENDSDVSDLEEAKERMDRYKKHEHMGLNGDEGKDRC